MSDRKYTNTDKDVAWKLHIWLETTNCTRPLVGDETPTDGVRNMVKMFNVVRDALIDGSYYQNRVTKDIAIKMLDDIRAVTSYFYKDAMNEWGLDASRRGQFLLVFKETQKKLREYSDKFLEIINAPTFEPDDVTQHEFSDEPEDKKDG